jgi:nucleotide-binding universal stress UspA family protein
MSDLRKILVATDHSERARHAEMRAGMLGSELNAATVELMGARYGNAVTAVQAAPPAETVTLQGAGAALRETLAAVPALFLHGADPAGSRTPRADISPAATVRRADEMAADLIVAAGSPDSFLAGIASRFRNEELIRLSERPVLLVNRTPEKAYQNVLVGTDFSPESRNAARVALAMAPDAHFTFLHVFQVVDEGMMLAHDVSIDIVHGYRMRAREAARVKLNNFIETLGPRRQLILRALERGVPGPLIHRHAERIHADLVVVGKHGKSRLADFFLGSVTLHLLDYSDYDLLVTTAPCGDEPDPRSAA